jgi:hypothetical protein
VEATVTSFGDASPPPFLDWYAAVAADDAAMIWAKAKEYGGLDLHAFMLQALVGRHLPQHAALDGVLAFYVAGKLTRIVEGISRGVTISPDHWRDTVCYAMVARRIRETKTWPA